MRVMVSAKNEKCDSHYRIHVEVGGAFVFDADPSDADLESLAKVNCSAIVFPYLREVVSDLIKRGGG